MMIYAHVLNELVKKDQGFDNGTLVTQLMWNRTFQGKEREHFFINFLNAFSKRESFEPKINGERGAQLKKSCRNFTKNSAGYYNTTICFNWAQVLAFQCEHN